jgi:CheY-like chemotaxis protein
MPAWVAFSVVDAGPGITPEVANQLFTPFFTTKPEGMGLGLSLCRTVIEQHGGALDFGPPEGPGSDAGHRVPVYAAYRHRVWPRPATRLSTPRMNPALDPALGIPTVYLVDDEDVVRDGLAWLLRSRRMLSPKASPAPRPSEACWLQRARPRRLPGRRRLPACCWTCACPASAAWCCSSGWPERGLLPVLPVIFLTGHGDVPTAVAAVKRGAFDFVEKPFSNNALVDRIEQALRSAPRHCAGAPPRQAVSRGWPS